MSQKLQLQIDKHISIVPVEEEYADSIHIHFTTEIITFLQIESLSGKIEDTLTFVRKSIEQRKKYTDLVWVILYKGKFAGCCGIHDIPSKVPHFGIWIRNEDQRKGIGSRVVRFVLQWGIDNLDVEYIKYPVDRRNTASVKLIRKLGLKCYDHYNLGDTKRLETDEYRIFKNKALP